MTQQRKTALITIGLTVGIVVIVILLLLLRSKPLDFIYQNF